MIKTLPPRTSPLALALALALTVNNALAQAGSAEVTLPTVNVNASADASAQGLQPVYPGGQVARGGRVGILGTRDIMDTPFSTTSYTNELIQDRQARSVGDVLQNDPTVRVRAASAISRSRTLSAASSSVPTTWHSTASTA